MKIDENISGSPPGWEDAGDVGGSVKFRLIPRGRIYNCFLYLLYINILKDIREVN
ncbi:MAG: hypothetical protein IJT56_00830 [Clostridia bacterium]|nr:hypothetical protein [Clostridia bacterium]